MTSDFFSPDGKTVRVCVIAQLKWFKVVKMSFSELFNSYDGK